MSLRPQLIAYLLVTAFGCAVDLATKEIMFAWRPPPIPPRPGTEWWLIENYVGIETNVNHGALFGMGQGWTWLFVSLSAAAVVGIVVWLFRYRLATDWTLTLALGCITGGILGNLYDRLGLWAAAPEHAHGVRDWILFRYGTFTWPNFNIADSLLVCGAGWLMWHTWRTGEPQVAKSQGVS